MDVFGSSGVRGVVGDGLTPAFVGRIASAAGETLGAETVALARDTRTTGRMLADVAAGTLASIGADVDRLGVLPTPGVQAYADRHGVPAVMITASHNPPAYNGVKLIGDDGVEFPKPTLERIEDRLSEGDEGGVGYASVGRSRSVTDADDAYVRELLDTLEAEGRRDRIAGADLTVALDPGHGAGCLTSPGFFRELGCRVVTVNAQPDGHFPGRDPEPLAANLSDLRRLVRASDADVGIAHDGDADRAIFVDEEGRHVDGEASFAALAAAELDAGDAFVSAVNVSQRLVDVVETAGAEVALTPIGSTHLITRIRELRSSGRSVPIAGEGNGGVFFPEFRIARDGAYTAARVLDLLVDRPASEIAADYGEYVTRRRNLEYGDPEECEAMLSAAESYAQWADAELTTIDGYRLDYGDGWVLVRPSGTEPLVRLYAEARQDDRAEALLEAIYEAIANDA
ncbi:phosphohexomutase (phosphoglucomutase / phosphomannomutase) [Natronomonas moolapensis 8.8.11]|uniref:Phosphohexomutase (Phosphoglucomutase / phosphomannomutase) n=1 Tax=Natronomonas moolapensis (strain DSM 18674 / CECT 7526 / JCM 14361 / 8.8.11) TaxID=268739 RepID=M1XSQ9_NATM8|nr:phosphoglucosamine mutase [Natronomonas moolapensis]CCQ37415.1 phosphohexomutase (phosphoglucomutase / phosphomannomutase) [Natronomonas moolapensis 8.8.11]